MAQFDREQLATVLGERGYIRGPFGSALVRHELLDHGIAVYEQQHAITGTRGFRYFIDEQKFRELSRFQVRPNDLIISCSGTIGRISVIRPGDPSGIISQALLILRPLTERILPEFLYYFLQGPEGQHELVQASHGSVQVNIAPRAVVEKIEVPIPSLDEQRAIASVLGSLDNKMELNRHMNETLEEMARTLFKSWFVDFDPVRAKMEGRQPYGMDDETADLFPDSFEDSPLGEIPKGWATGTVSDDFNITMGQSPPGETYNEVGEGLPFYQGRRDFKFRYPALRVYCSAPKRTAQSGDALISVRAPVGDVNMAESVCCVGRGVAAVRHKTGSRSYTYYAMHSLKSYFERFESEGTVFGAINKKGFATIPFLLPPSALIERFESSFFPLDQCIEVQEWQSRTLATIRDTLLPKLLSGEVRVHEAEEIVEEAI